MALVSSIVLDDPVEDGLSPLSSNTVPVYNSCLEAAISNGDVGVVLTPLTFASSAVLTNISTRDEVEVLR
ncbi:hypothetical protein ES707_15697 [subsurface metagenome]